VGIAREMPRVDGNENASFGIAFSMGAHSASSSSRPNAFDVPAVVGGGSSRRMSAVHQFSRMVKSVGPVPRIYQESGKQLVSFLPLKNLADLWSKLTNPIDPRTDKHLGDGRLIAFYFPPSTAWSPGTRD